MFYTKTDKGFQPVGTGKELYTGLRTKGLIDEKGDAKGLIKLYTVGGVVPVKKDATLETVADTTRWLMSDATLDSYMEKIDPNAWQLERFLKNPVILWSHRHDYLPIGRVVKLDKTPTGLYGYFKFTPKEMPHTGKGPSGYSVEMLVRGGFLSACSVGFILKRIEWTKDDPDEPADAVITLAELMEVSVVTVPANPNALVQESVIVSQTKETLDIFEKRIDSLEALFGAQVAKSNSQKTTGADVATQNQGSLDNLWR